MFVFRKHMLVSSNLISSLLPHSPGWSAAGSSSARFHSLGVASPRGPLEAAAGTPGEPAEGERGGSAERGEASRGERKGGAEAGGELTGRM